MTVSVSSNSVTYYGNGVTNTFTFTFPAVSAEDINDYYVNAAGVETLLLPSQYTLTLNPIAPGAIWSYGGSVSYVYNSAPIAIGTSISIVRIVPLTQTTSISNQGNFSPQVIESAMDTLCFELQQVAGVQGRAVQFPVVDPASLNSTLPPALSRANQYLAFDVNGNVITTSGTTTTPDLTNSHATASGATRSRTLGSHFSDILSVMDFGAVGDGATDDSAAFTAALASGNPIYLPVPPGGAYIVGDVVVPNYSYMFGFGNLDYFTVSSKIVVRRKAGCAYVFNLASNANFVFSGFCVDGVDQTCGGSGNQ